LFRLRSGPTEEAGNVIEMFFEWDEASILWAPDCLTLVVPAQWDERTALIVAEELPSRLRDQAVCDVRTIRAVDSAADHAGQPYGGRLEIEVGAVNDLHPEQLRNQCDALLEDASSRARAADRRHRAEALAFLERLAHG
jgi:hypothetical protein